MHNKYKVRKDISVLVIEKNLRPEGTSISEHNISSVGFFLNGYGFKVDMVWDISDYKFEDFETFKRQAEEIKDNRYANEEDKMIREILESDLPSYELLRKNPINSLDDLAEYNFIVAHPCYEDSEMLSEFGKKYPDIPLICSDGSANIGSGIGSKEFLSEVKRDIFGVYILHYPDICLGTVQLIEYLLDQNPNISSTRNSE